MIKNKTVRAPLVETVVIDTSFECSRSCAGCYLKQQGSGGFSGKQLSDLLYLLKKENITREVSLGINPGGTHAIIEALRESRAVYHYPDINLQCHNIQDGLEIKNRSRAEIKTISISSVDPVVLPTIELEHTKLAWNFRVKNTMVQGNIGIDTLMQYERYFDFIYLNRDKQQLARPQRILQHWSWGTSTSQERAEEDYCGYFAIAKGCLNNPEKLMQDVCTIDTTNSYCYKNVAYVAPNGSVRACPYSDQLMTPQKATMKAEKIVEGVRKMAEKKKKSRAVCPFI